ncbi:hypothetical protein BDR07DRAFT_1609233 [Suillus spraguei]|nr:hypothetical protein BDR07DRAFT_1609233 [Suillus spraguei]
MLSSFSNVFQMQLQRTIFSASSVALTSITHPHIPSQVSFMNRLLKNTGIDAPRVSVVEAHGTGTQAGDFTRSPHMAWLCTGCNRHVGHQTQEDQINTMLKSGSYSDLCHMRQQELSNTGSKACLLDVLYGYHSQAMDPVLDDLTQLARTVPLSSPKVSVGSTVLARLVPAGDTSTFDATYFSSHFRQPVTVDTLRKHPSVSQMGTWIEMGPQTSRLLIIRARVAATTSGEESNSILTSSLSQLYEPALL